MPESSSEPNSPVLANLVNGSLAILTLIGGLYYFHNRPLASDRPVALPTESKEFGGQSVEARLWEDPLKDINPKGNVNKLAQTQSEVTDSAAEKLKKNTYLREQLIENIVSKNSSNSTVIILPVMLEDGQYSEDQESRIRTRFAVVAALGVRGFVPQDAEHIERIPVLWPKESELSQCLKNCLQQYSIETNKAKGQNLKFSPGSDLISAHPTTNAPPPDLLSGLSQASPSNSYYMDLRFEWFVPREFYPNSANFAIRTNVLVLWLRENLFADEPLVRLPLLLYCLGETNNSPDWQPIKLIGPALSSTLRRMLPNQFSGTEGFSSEMPFQVPEISRLLHQIDMFAASPRAMDEVLVSNATSVPREAVRKTLTAEGFRSFHNFAATDSQIATEACEELKLRNVDLANPDNHLVLIAEWDTFYSRMLSLTFQAKVAGLQEKSLKLEHYIDDYREGFFPDPPTNFHRFYYLRGLDGQTVATDDQSLRKPESGAEKSLAQPVMEFRQWMPDANKAEGASQLDYVSRLGDRLEGIEENLKHTHAGHIKAVGIAASDVYDTLIVLQALRSRFPEAVFFTTDLDARLWHPKEIKWSRNLIVVSGYGLTLAEPLQRGATPFRDSDQTALYAATMAALGDTNLLTVTSIPPRRFEIGRHGIVDLSVINGFIKGASNAVGFDLHPPTTREGYRERPYMLGRLCWGFCVLAIVSLVPCLFVKSAKRATWRWSKFLCRSLLYSTEDLGGPDGAAILLRQLQANPDPFCKWLTAEIEAEFMLVSEPNFLKSLKTIEASGVKSNEERFKLQEMHLQLADAMAAALNRVIKHATEKKPGDYKIYETNLLPDHIHSGARFLNPSTDWETCGVWGRLTKYRKRLGYYGQSRTGLDGLLKRLPNTSDLAEALHPPSQAGGFQAVKSSRDIAAKLKDVALETAGAARDAGIEIVRLRWRKRKWVIPILIAAGFVGLCLAISIWRDTYYRADGQPLSFENGACAWPAQVSRLAAIVFAVYSCVAVYFRKRIAFAKITRQFRFTPNTPNKPPAGRICAVRSWLAYTKERNWPERAREILLPFCLYFAFCLAIFAWSGAGTPMSPIRGAALTMWNGVLLMPAVIFFLFLTFLTIDTSLRCQKFILKLGAAPTDYPEATRRHFARLNGDLDEFYLDEWIDVQLIAELTEQIGGMLYYPSFVFCFLLIARNSIWAQWSWPTFLLIIFGFNLLLALTSVLILQMAADRAKRQAIANLKVKVKRLENLVSASAAESNATQAKRLLEEITSLRRGAFARAWESPILGAILLPSGGLTIVQAAIMILGR